MSDAEIQYNFNLQVCVCFNNEEQFYDQLKYPTVITSTIHLLKEPMPGPILRNIDSHCASDAYGPINKKSTKPIY